MLKMKKILVPIDGTELAAHVLGHVRRLLLRQDAQVMLVFVRPLPRPGQSPIIGLELARSAQRYLGQLKRSFLNYGTSADFRILDGDSAREILAFAETYKPSLIAMATHGRTGVKRFFSDSVTETVLRKSPFPVLALNPLAAGCKSNREQNYR